MTMNSSNAAISGGNVWQPVKTRKKSVLIARKVLPYTTALSLVGILAMIIHGFLYFGSLPAQKENVFVIPSLYGEEWEIRALLAFFALFAVSFFIWMDDTMIGIMLTVISIGILSITTQIPLLSSSSNTSSQLAEWMHDKQQLNFLTDKVSIPDLTDNKRILMSGNNKKIYYVTFENVDGRITILDKTEQ